MVEPTDAAAKSSARTSFTLMLLLLLGAAAPALAQEGGYAAGQTIEAKSYFYDPPWQKAKIVRVGGSCSPGTPYRVHFIDVPDHGDPCIGANEIRPLPGEERQAAAAPAARAGAADAGRLTGRPARNGAYHVGDRVDVWASYDKDKGRRGTVIEVAGNRYKVHYDGCDPRRDGWEEIQDLHPAATISPTAAEIRFLVGNWAMFTPSYPNTIVRGNSVYREYGMGAKAPPLQIKADGTYVWHFDFGKPPVSGRWVPHAKIEGTQYGTETWDGVIIKAPGGGEWMVHRWNAPGDTSDHITAQTMCSGQTVTGKRI